MTAVLTADERLPLYRVIDGRVKAYLHYGQRAAMESDRRVVAVLAGTRGGKSSLGPVWLDQEVRRRGPGDYLAVTSNYKLFDAAMLPALRGLFIETLRVGKYWPSSHVIELCDPVTRRFYARRASDRMWGRIVLRSAESPGGLEAFRAKAAWLDEVGQDSFTLQAWEAVQRRVMQDAGRLLLTTTIYNFNWLKTEVYDRWRDGDEHIDVIHFPSSANPAVPAAEVERAKVTLPPWRYVMQYEGRYERPAGMIYDCFRDEPCPAGHVCPRFDVPWTWPRLVGLDFGGAHTAAVFFATDPATGVRYAYREYLAGGLTAAQHAAALRAGEPDDLEAVGGSWSEGQWRDEFAAAGFPVRKPDVSEVEIGINRVYGAIKTGRTVFFDDLTGGPGDPKGGLLGELRSYSRKLDAAGRPGAEIQDKSQFHRLDSVRYALGWAEGPGPARSVVRAGRNPLAGYRGGAGGR